VLAPTPDEVRYINFSLFPASYTTDDGLTSGDQLRIIATSDHLVAFTDKGIVGAVWSLTFFEKVDRNTYRVITADNVGITVRRENNCGCGNQLRGWNPYVGKPHIAHYPQLKGT
jgi:hypothetical protein